MDKELDRLFSPSQWSSRGSPQQVIEDFYEFTTCKTIELQKEFHVEKNERYSSKTGTLVDIYSTDSLAKDSPVLVYVHGGFWQEGSKDCYGIFKEFLRNGVRVMVPGYDLAPRVNLGEIVEEMKEFFTFLRKYCSNNNVENVWLCGHSAGAQLVLSVLYDLPQETSISVISGIILISGLYDLRPVTKTYNNIKLKLTLEEAERWSPVRWLDDNYVKRLQNLQILVAIGEEESPAFKEQSAIYAKWLEERGIRVDYVSVPDCDHFNIVTDLYHKDFLLTSSILDLILHSSN